MRNAIFLLLFALAGCASLSWQRPQVELESLAFAGGNLKSQKLRLDLRVRNPNARAIELESVSFDLLLDGERFAGGGSSSPQRIEAGAQGRLALEARVQWLELLRRVSALELKDGKLAYRVKGEAVVSGFGRVPFEQPGELDVSRWLGRSGSAQE